MRSMVWRECKQVVRHADYFALLILLPALSLLALQAVINQPVVSEVPFAIVDLDQSNASLDLSQRLDSGRSLKVDLITTNLNEAMQLADSWDIAGFVVIANGYQKSLLSGQGAEIHAYVNQQSYMQGSLLTTQLLRQVNQQSIEQSASRFLLKGQSLDQVRVNAYPLEQEIQTWGNAYLNYQGFLLLGLQTHVWHILATMASVFMLGREFKQSSNKEWFRPEVALWTQLVGKSIPLHMSYALLIGVIYAVTLQQLHLFSVQLWANLMLISTVFQVFYWLVGLFLVALFHNYRFALSAAAFYTTPAFAFVGISFPTFDMNWLAQFWQALLPITQLLNIQHELIFWHTELTDYWLSLAYLLLIGLILWASIQALLYRKLTDARYWGKH